ncbi:unnamed protein product, partial [Menidia menidia]
MCNWFSAKVNFIHSPKGEVEMRRGDVGREGGLGVVRCSGGWQMQRKRSVWGLPPVLTELPVSYTAFSLEDISMPCVATGNPPPTGVNAHGGTTNPSIHQTEAHLQSKCSCSKNDFYTSAFSFRWVKNGEEFGPERNNSGTLKAGGEEPLEYYAGHYRCYASNALGTAMTQTVKVIIEPQPVLVKQQKLQKSAFEGEGIILTCNPPKSSTPPHIHWMDKRMVHITQSERKTIGLDGYLYFSNLLVTDSRNDYICNAQYAEARTILPETAVNLTVMPSNDVLLGRKPELFRPTGHHTSVLALRGHSLTLECIPKGLGFLCLFAVPDMNPTGVQSDSTDPETLIITWPEMDNRWHNGQDFHYKVSWCEAEATNKQWRHAYVKSPPFLVNNTEAYTAFKMKVQAVNAVGKGPEPEAVIGHSGEDKPEEAPHGISTTVLNSTVIVTWNPAQRVQGLLLGYKIYIKRLGPQTGHGLRPHGHLHNEEIRETMEGVKHRGRDSWEVEVRGPNTSKEVAGLRLFSLYELSVTAFNSKGESPHSRAHHFKTPEGAPGPPASLSFESPTETSLILFWTPPLEINGILRGYVVQYQQNVDNGHSLLQMEIISDPNVNHIMLNNLDPQHYYTFKVIARTTTGDGPPITRRGATLLNGVPPTNITVLTGSTSFNLSWVPGERHRNHGFRIRYKKNGKYRIFSGARRFYGFMSGVEFADAESEKKTTQILIYVTFVHVYAAAVHHWEDSGVVNTTQGFHSLAGLQPGSQYHLQIFHDNRTHWENVVWTLEPEMPHGFATKGWLVGLISAIVLLVLILLILCLIKRRKGGKYSVKDREDKQLDSEALPVKDETFGEYSDVDEKHSASRTSVGEDSRLGSEDSLAEYGDSVDIQFNEDGSFIGQYSGRERIAHGNESSDPASPPRINWLIRGFYFGDPTVIIGLYEGAVATED